MKILGASAPCAPILLNRNPGEKPGRQIGPEGKNRRNWQCRAPAWLYCSHRSQRWKARPACAGNAFLLQAGVRGLGNINSLAVLAVGEEAERLDGGGFGEGADRAVGEEDVDHRRI